MKTENQAFWIETSLSEPLPADLTIRDNELKIILQNGSTHIWSKSGISVLDVPGSTGKFYIHQEAGPYPRILLPAVVEGIPGLKARNSRLKNLIPAVVLYSGMVIGIISTIILLIWKGLPLLADRMAVAVPVELEQEIGELLKKQVLESMEVDSGKTMLINKLMKEYSFLPAKGEGFQRPEFVVVKKEEFNAFAMPGGCIVIHSGALDKMDHLPAFMALVGHENGHVQGRHSLRTLARSLGLYALITAIAGDFTGLAAVLVENAQSLQTLSYSRDFEREADQASLDFLCRNRLEPVGLIYLMETMQKVSEKSRSSIPAILSSHPLTEERLANARIAVSSVSCPFFNRPKADSLFRLLKQH